MKQQDIFDPSYFERLRKAEKKHFWFQIRRRWIFDKVKKYIIPPAKVLEIGCGTGNVSHFLAQKGYTVIGCEFYIEAIHRAWPDFLRVQGDANCLPFKDNSFDIVGLFDIIEHFHDDVNLLKEALRLVREGGIIVVTVPAREELWSWFDKIAFHKRRYTQKKFQDIFMGVNLNLLLMEYMFMSLYLPMKYSRNKDRGKNDLFSISSLTNPLLKGIFHVERLISKGLPLPIGTSLIAVARKNT
jgi:SAM-dependent methyltransferase